MVKNQINEKSWRHKVPDDKNKFTNLSHDPATFLVVALF